MKRNIDCHKIIMSKKRESLADKIAGVLSAAPVSFDPEEDTNVETTAKVTECEEEEFDQDEILLSKFRKQNIDLLEDVDSRYAGKKGSRKELKDSSDEELDENRESSNEDSIDEIDEEPESESNEDNSSDEEDSDGQDEFDITEDEDNFKHMRDVNVSQQMNKGLCVRNQLNLWENLLEMRIQLQKCLITSNKMPQYQMFKELKSNTNEFTKNANDTTKILTGVLDNMLKLQNVFLKKYPETKKILKNNKPEQKNEESDEEIPSDTDTDSTEEVEVKISPKKKRKLSDYESELNKFHNLYKPYRNTVIQKWNEKTRMAVGKNSSGHSVLNQIEHNLSDHNRLIKRTQLKRSEYDIIGVTLSSEPQQNEENLSRVTEEYNSEIFDDDDFYHQLLRELIEVKSADLTDPVQLGRQWIQLQNLRSKMKRKIDTKATKGRKIRYAIHTKLVNFMAPIDENNYTDDAKTELYNSLFGKSQRLQVV